MSPGVASIALSGASICVSRVRTKLSRQLSKAVPRRSWIRARRSPPCQVRVSSAWISSMPSRSDCRPRARSEGAAIWAWACCIAKSIARSAGMPAAWPRTATCASTACTIRSGRAVSTISSPTASAAAPASSDSDPAMTRDSSLGSGTPSVSIWPASACRSRALPRRLETVCASEAKSASDRLVRCTQPSETDAVARICAASGQIRPPSSSTTFSPSPRVGPVRRTRASSSAQARAPMAFRTISEKACNVWRGTVPSPRRQEAGGTMIGLIGVNSRRVKLKGRPGRSTASRARSGATSASAAPRSSMESTRATTRATCSSRAALSSSRTPRSSALTPRDKACGRVMACNHSVAAACTVADMEPS